MQNSTSPKKKPTNIRTHTKCNTFANFQQYQQHELIHSQPNKMPLRLTLIKWTLRAFHLGNTA